MVADRAIRGRVVPCGRSDHSGTREIGVVESGTSCMAARSLGDQRRRVRGPHRLRTIAVAQLARDDSVSRIVGGWPRGLRARSRSKNSFATFPCLRPRAMAGCDGAARICRRSSRGCRARSSAEWNAVRFDGVTVNPLPIHHVTYPRRAVRHGNPDRAG